MKRLGLALLTTTVLLWDVGCDDVLPPQTKEEQTVLCSATIAVMEKDSANPEKIVGDLRAMHKACDKLNPSVEPTNTDTAGHSQQGGAFPSENLSDWGGCRPSQKVEANGTFVCPPKVNQ
jgi:hypothetical protein